MMCKSTWQGKVASDQKKCVSGKGLFVVVEVALRDVGQDHLVGHARRDAHATATVQSAIAMTLAPLPDAQVQGKSLPKVNFSKKSKTTVILTFS
jgi:hypothetical protein